MALHLCSLPNALLVTIASRLPVADCARLERISRLFSRFSDHIAEQAIAVIRQRSAADFPGLPSSIVHDRLSLSCVDDASRVRCPSTGGTEADCPALHDVTVRPYQVRGFRWLERMYSAEISAMLHDESGLGNRMQLIALLAHLKAAPPGESTARSSLSPGVHLVVGSIRSMDLWLRELARACPALRPLKFHGPRAHREELIREHLQRAGEASESGEVPPGDEPLAAPARAFDVCVTTFETLLAEHASLASVSWGLLVVDTSSLGRFTLENKMTQALQSLRRRACVLKCAIPPRDHVQWVFLLFFLLGTKQAAAERLLTHCSRLTHSTPDGACGADRLSGGGGMGAMGGVAGVERVVQALVRPFVLRRTVADADVQRGI